MSFRSQEIILYKSRINWTVIVSLQTEVIHHFMFVTDCVDSQRVNRNSSNASPGRTLTQQDQDNINYAKMMIQNEKDFK